MNLNGSVIISYGDIIFEKKILDSLINSKEDFSVIIDKKWKEYWFARMDEPIKDAESLKLDSNGYITNIGEPVKNIDEIEGQYIGLMKFQNEGLKIMKEFYNKMKNKAKESGNNPLNPNIPFKKSYMTDFIRGLIVDGHKIKAIPIENGWLELDTYQDYKIYERMFDEKTISRFYQNGRRKMKKPNIVLILLDGARWDRLEKSQEFQEIINEGTLLNNVNTAIPYTIGSVNALFSGRYGKDNGIDAYYKMFRLKESVKILPEFLKELNYFTACDLLSEKIISKRGFDLHQFHDEYNDDLTRRHIQNFSKNV